MTYLYLAPFQVEAGNWRQILWPFLYFFTFLLAMLNALSLQYFHPIFAGSTLSPHYAVNPRGQALGLAH